MAAELPETAAVFASLDDDEELTTLSGRDRKLWIHEPDAERVRAIFRRFVQLKSATLLARELIAANERNRYGHLLDKGVLYKLLNNRVYIGEAVHKGTAYPGEHESIINKKLWDEAHAILKGSPRTRAGQARAQTPALLRGKLFGPDGAAMSPTHTRKAGRLYRYYVSQTAMKRGASDCPVRQVPAAEIEKIVIDQMRLLLQTPEVIIQTWRAARKARSIYPIVGSIKPRDGNKHYQRSHGRQTQSG